ncbi:MAG: hypothetical protein KBA91_03015 [Candidatus Moranbacteria bacterium]|nr:hypothetical protein [Candidatus Moranbacteria bacterium]
MWGKKMQSVPPQSQKPVEEVSEASKTENLDTSNWKTYRNEKLGFQFQYPPNWVLEERYDDYDIVISRYVSLKPLASKDFRVEVGVKNNSESDKILTRTWQTGFAVSGIEFGGNISNSSGIVERQYGIFQNESYRSGDRIVRLMWYCAPKQPIDQCDNFQIGGSKSAFLGIHIDNDDLSENELKNIEDQVDFLFSTIVSF